MDQQSQTPNPAKVTEESLGQKATRVAAERANKWLEDTWRVIEKTVLDTAARGLFHCTLRFTDVVPQDSENQRRLLKILEKQNIAGTFKNVEANEEAETEAYVSLYLSWGPDLL
eukprot:CAMPEP_0168550358 /NCGR_PEP_ID=MMETSP0413-20121227/5595_1 /TAXON_ID=136452 /ORGANISM="Filamoeba nolandi, Strain NC-AS-23-1" /LENGTH=113 /DNA_ID=CAMNT_0008580809 /DNA_START=30 /DNA_END=371 /DNA_ORIENTATION=-